MARAISRTRAGFLAGSFKLGLHGGHRGSVAQMVHDGDTINVATALNFAVRFLGIDTPEVSYRAPGTETFVGITHPAIVSLLADPFAPNLAPITGLSAALRADIQGRAAPTAAANHATLAEGAHRELEKLVLADMAELHQDKETFSFFLAFAYEAIEGYGRLLCYVHPDQPQATEATRKLSYNERMLTTGFAAPYFIFPNVDPFRSQGSPLRAALDAHSPQRILSNAPRLRAARAAVQAARAAGAGIFDPAQALVFDAFELRYLADRRAPNRWLIDLSGDDRVLHHPQTYLHIPHAEDRLWVPEEFVSLFVAAGWERGPSPADMG